MPFLIQELGGMEWAGGAVCSAFGNQYRTLASTQLNEVGRNDRWIETQLSHADRNKIRGAYSHKKYSPQRRTMMQARADYLDSSRARTEATGSHQVGSELP
jgi:hypothetical protein